MEFSRPHGLLSGFHARDLEALHPAFRHAGEQWAPTDFSINWHRHPVWEFYLQVEGETHWETEDTALKVARHSFLGIAPGIRHRMARRPEAAHHFIYAAIDPEPFQAGDRELWRDWAAPGFILLPDMEGLLEPFRYLIREVTQESLYQTEGLDIAARALLIQVLRFLQGREKSRARFMQHPAVSRCRELLEQHPEHPWTLEVLGNMAGLAPNYLLERFRRETATTPHRYLVQCRIARARESLARNDQSLTRIAHDLGFGSSQHFSNCFKKHCGESPSAYRKRMLQSAT